MCVTRQLTFRHYSLHEQQIAWPQQVSRVHKREVVYDRLYLCTDDSDIMLFGALQVPADLMVPVCA
jgi:hypothetical protein